VKLFRICEKCNKEFEVDLDVSPFGIGSISTTQNCSHCNSKNDIWVRVVENNSQESSEEKQNSTQQLKAEISSRLKLVARAFNSEDIDSMSKLLSEMKKLTAI